MNQNVVDKAGSAVFEQQQHIILIWAEAFAIGVFALAIVFILYSVYSNPTIPTTVKNRVLFGLLTFALLVFLVKEFGAGLSKDSQALLIGGIGGSITTIVMFLFDKDKENKDNGDGNTEIAPYPQE